MIETVLITGASSGIGQALARCFARSGYKLVLASRDEPELQAVAAELSHSFQASVHIELQDLAKPGSAKILFEKLQDQGLSVDILVNNAGFGYYGPFAGMDSALATEMIQLNDITLTELTRLCLDAMLANGRGKILNVASTAAFQPGPLMAVYYASKAYVLYFSEALSRELEGTGVTVTALCPGPTPTQFQVRAAVRHSHVFKGTLTGLTPVEQVAEDGFKGLMAGKPIVIPGFRNKLIPFLVRFFPRAWVIHCVHEAQQPIDRGVAT